MDETHLKVWQPPAPFVGTSTSRSTFEALRHEEGARPAAISTLSRKNPDWVGHKERAGIVDKRDWQSSHRADFRHFPGDNRAKRTEFVSASLKPPAEAEAEQPRIIPRRRRRVVIAAEAAVEALGARRVEEDERINRLRRRREAQGERDEGHLARPTRQEKGVCVTACAVHLPSRV